MTHTRMLWLNMLGLLAVCGVLLFALADQVIYNDIPCPLCILQRAGLIAAGTGLALNLGFGIRPSHYGIMILGALISGGVATRQILLHIIPGTGAYGNSVLGLHFYTWDLIVSLLITIGGAMMLLFDRQFSGQRSIKKKPHRAAMLAVVLIALIAFANGISTILLCGGGVCPADPTHYLLLP